MDLKSQYEALILKGARNQVLINAIINALVPAATMSGMVKLFEVGGMVQDFLVMNTFLIFFVFIFSRLDIVNWRKKNNAKPMDFDEVMHKGLKKAMTRHPLAEFFLMYFKYTAFTAVPVIAICHFVYGEAGIPVDHFVFIKTAYAVLLANACAMRGGKLGSLVTPKEKAEGVYA